MLRRTFTLFLGIALFVPVLSATAADTAPGKRVLFIAGFPSHGPGEHEHKAGCMLLSKSLDAAMPNFDTAVSFYGWPKEADAFENIDAVVMYCDGGMGHYANKHLDEIQALVDKGVGIVCIHYAVEFPKSPSGEKFLQWIGGYFEADWSVNPHWTADFKKMPAHPICNGIQAFAIEDEWYYHMRFPEGMKGVTPILTALPGPDTLTRPDGPHEGNPAVREAVAKGEEQHVAWAFERPDGGRGFGYTGGHFHKNWQDDHTRNLVLNAIIWAAKGEVPKEGANSPTPTDAEMKENLDKKGR
jgi:type 1 glutamine amidotransferase